MKEEEDDALSAKPLKAWAIELNCGKSTLEAAIKNGELAMFRVGQGRCGKKFVRVAEMQRWIAWREDREHA